jgi:hypothetical protein
LLIILGRIKKSKLKKTRKRDFFKRYYRL